MKQKKKAIEKMETAVQSVEVQTPEQSKTVITCPRCGVIDCVPNKQIGKSVYWQCQRAVCRNIFVVNG